MGQRNVTHGKRSMHDGEKYRLGGDDPSRAWGEYPNSLDKSVKKISALKALGSFFVGKVCLSNVCCCGRSSRVESAQVCSVEGTMIHRRGFLSSFAGIAGALGTAPKWTALLEQEAPKLPDSALYGSNEEAYWTEMRKQFLIPPDEVYLNNGTVGSSPVPVLRAVFDGYNDTEKMAQSDPEDYPIWGYGPWNEFRDPLAAFVGCTRDELALVRNATEANSYIANGLGCDMYTSSPHKWLQAPKGSGFLYVRDEVIDRLWNTIVTAGWDEPKLRAERFQRIGSSNVPALWGMRAAVHLANQIGMERIERRHRQMADYILKAMVQHGAESWTSPDAALRCAIASVNVAPIQITEIENWMWKTKKIRIRGGGPSKIRLSTPYYLLRKDVDRYLAAFDEYKKGKAAA